MFITRIVLRAADLLGALPVGVFAALARVYEWEGSEVIADDPLASPL